MVISSRHVHGYLNCGCIYHERSRRNKLHYPVCGRWFSCISCMVFTEKQVNYFLL